MGYFKKQYVTILVLAGLVMMQGCAGLPGKLEQSARTSYTQGDYDRAVMQCAEALKLNPAYVKAQELIQTAFKQAVDVHRTKIDEISASAEKFKWDTVVVEYQKLIELNKTIKFLPALIDKNTKQPIVFEIVDYTQNLAKAKQNAAEVHYKEGVRLSKLEGLDNQKQSAKQFKGAQYFVPGYKDSEELYDKTRKAGLKRIAIIPFADKTGKSQYGALNESIVDGVVSRMVNTAEAREFVDVISRDQLEQVMREQKLMLTDIIDETSAIEAGKVLGVHEIVTGKITQIVVTPERTMQSNINQSKQICVSRKTYIDKKGKQQVGDCNYAEVSATVTIYTRTASASISGSYNIIEIKTAKVKSSKAFKGIYNFESKWATYTGDERAVSVSYPAEQMAPGEDDMVNRAVEDLTNSISSALVSYAL